MVQITKKLLELPIYVGIDVHKEKWVISIYEGRQKVETYSMSSDLSALQARLRTKYGGRTITCVYEAGFCGFWIQQQLTRSGIECIVAHAADIPTTDYERRRKSDKLDSDRLACQLSLGNIKGIYIPSAAQLELRSLVRARQTVAKDKRRWMCRIRSFLDFHGIIIPKAWKKRLWNKKGLNWLWEKAATYKGLRSYLSIYTYLRKEELAAAREIRNYIVQSEFKSTYDYLLSIPGIGWTIGSLLISELGNMDRFASLNKLAGFCGLVPDVRSSADRHQNLGLSKRANRQLRRSLIESAWISIRFDSQLGSVYRKAIEENKPSQKAIIKVARKLLNRIRAVWLKQEKYKISKA